MPDIFKYTDYRKFISDYYAEQKAALRAFSYQYFARKAGIPNKGFLYNVISGHRNISESMAIKIARAMELTNKETDYFENLVSLNQAQSLWDKDYFLNKVLAIKSTKKGSGSIRRTRLDQLEFYSKWYYSVVRSLLDMHDFKDDYARLARSVYPPILPKEAKRAVQLLLKLGLIEKQKEGNYTLTDKTITTGPDILKAGLLNFQLESAELAKNAIRELPSSRRHISGLTLGISRKTYEAICREIESFQEKLLGMAEEDKEADNVYQFNFQFFPASNVQK